MTQLLHIDASIRSEAEGSVSRNLSAFFAGQWRQAHPDGGYVYRDLRTEPVPHISYPVREHLFDPAAGDHGTTPADRALAAELISEVRAASTIVFGMPMYNYTVPSTAKAWIDQLVVPAHMIPPGATSGALSGTRVIIVSARGGSYAPGTPREGFDFHTPYLEKVLGAIGLGDDLHFVSAEMTFAETVPALAQFKPIAEKTLDSAYDTLKKLAAGS